ncbi:ATP-binding protein [Herpetosiphon sp. NSE202]|uniref:ATP-binding protein n=1 Tax=Herpetosiphon sp. NSE202 TaxID=3351349 RepID=UPI00363FBC6D
MTVSDLDQCATEPIHIPGMIQAHGLLLVLSEPDFQILQISANSLDFTGYTPEQLLNQSLALLITSEQLEYLRSVVAHEQLDQNPLYLWTVPLQATQKVCDGILHRHQGQLILEFEPALTSGTGPHDGYRMVRSIVARLQQIPEFQPFCDETVRAVRQLTGFDRVMIYQFDADGHGTVIAEAVDSNQESFLGLHYPASDIPPQARALYLRNWLRLIPDARYTPVAIVAAAKPDHEPLDLSYSVLRSVSPVHREYLANMGVRASMSVSLVYEGQLWGLIACHHAEPHYLSCTLRSACEVLGQSVSLALTSKVHHHDHAATQQLVGIQTSLLQQMTTAQRWMDGLVEGQHTLLDLIAAGGVAIHTNDELVVLGHTPSIQHIRAIISWIRAQPATIDDGYHTASLASKHPPFAALAAVASGVLAFPLVGATDQYLLWFRPEEIQTITWAGEPTKAVTIADDGIRISPRQSFAQWKEQRALHSVAWTDAELSVARTMRDTIRTLLLQQATALTTLNRALEQSNAELDAFAYSASHDLKEPLRGIHTYAHFLLEDYADKVDDAGQAKLQTMLRLTQRMDALLDSLLHHSRLGRVELQFQPVDLATLIHDVSDTLMIQPDMLEIRIPSPLPMLFADPLHLSEVMQNLLSNALKYSQAAQKWVEITAIALPLDAEQQPWYRIAVQDNGIGIAEAHYETIFRLFKRLHGRDHFGGGTGVGLTIAKKIIERHGGILGVQSTLGKGTTFTFTLRGA